MREIIRSIERNIINDLQLFLIIIFNDTFRAQNLGLFLAKIVTFWINNDIFYFFVIFWTMKIFFDTDYKTKKIPLRGSILVTELLQKFFQQLRQVFNVLGRHNND